jgi:hypothetical protein
MLEPQTGRLGNNGGRLNDHRRWCGRLSTLAEVLKKAKVVAEVLKATQIGVLSLLNTILNEPLKFTIDHGLKEFQVVAKVVLPSGEANFGRLILIDSTTNRGIPTKVGVLRVRDTIGKLNEQRGGFVGPSGGDLFDNDLKFTGDSFLDLGLIGLRQFGVGAGHSDEDCILHEAATRGVPEEVQVGGGITGVIEAKLNSTKVRHLLGDVEEGFLVIYKDREDLLNESSLKGKLQCRVGGVVAKLLDLPVESVDFLVPFVAVGSLQVAGESWVDAFKVFLGGCVAVFKVERHI